MGLFDSLKKGIDAVAKEVDKHKDDIEKFANDVKSQVGVQTQQSSFQPQAQPQPQTVEEEPSVYPQMGVATDQFDKFDRVIAENFADYEVKRNLPASELMPNCHPACTPVQFMFYKDGAPVLAVVLVKTNTYRGMNVIGTKNICEAMGVKYIRFYLEYPNEEDYIVKRIRENL